MFCHRLYMMKASQLLGRLPSSMEQVLWPGVSAQGLDSYLQHQQNSPIHPLHCGSAAEGGHMFLQQGGCQACLHLCADSPYAILVRALCKSCSHGRPSGNTTIS